MDTKLFQISNHEQLMLLNVLEHFHGLEMNILTALEMVFESPEQIEVVLEYSVEEK